MVWFQCEDCGDELKKPKLPNHFRICSASKLSCIDCGVMFTQHTVQTHTQCITEAEKYGPKGQANKVQNGGTPKPNKEQKPIDFDIYAGLSECPPWFCSLCNTKATSQQTLLLHADGKKHRAKAKAFHHANQPAKQSEEIANGGGNCLVDTNGPDAANGKSETMNEDLEKKRKHDDSETDGHGEMGGGDGLKGEKLETQVKKVKKNVVKDNKAIEADSLRNENETKIKWKKLIKSALQSNPEGVLKMKKLIKIVLKSLRESGSTEDESELCNVLEEKVNSSSKFRVEGKYVHLATKD